VLALLLVGLFAAELVGLPVCVVAGLGAGVLLAIAQRGAVVDNIKVIRGAPWDIVVFSLGMYLVVYGLQNVGLTAYLAGMLDVLGEQSLWVATVGTGVLAAFLSSVMNNMPTVLVVALSIDASQVSGLAQEAMIYANVVGSDLGPKITPIGSLATLLWLHVLARKGLTIGWGQYFRIGIVLTVPVLVVTLSALAGWLALIGA
jgi:arsenical pump membrane protein